MISQVSRIENIVQSYVIDKQFTGSILVAQNGQILLNKGYGFADIEWQIPNSPTTKFRLGSLTKQFTAVSVLLLEEMGKLKLTDNISKHLQNIPSTWDNITIYHLLTHTSGIPNYTKFPDFPSMTTIAKTPEEQIHLFRDKQLEFQPGSGYEYCNSGYILLGHLIEKISGLSYRDFLARNIYIPLGMSDSGYDSHSEIIPQRASGYEITPNGLRNTDYLDMSIPYAAGSLYSTTQDLYRWQNALFGREILSSQSFEKMIQPFKNSYGLGVGVQFIDGYKAITHGGGINGFNTFMIHFIEDNLTVIVLANLIALGFVPQSLGFNITKLLHNQSVILPSERKEISLVPGSLTKFIGSFTMTPVNIYYTAQSSILTISQENGHLIAQVANQPKIKLFPQSATSFFSRAPDVIIDFKINNQGEISSVSLYQDNDYSIGKKT